MVELKTKSATFKNDKGELITYDKLYVEINCFGKLQEITLTCKNPYAKQMLIDTLKK